MAGIAPDTDFADRPLAQIATFVVQVLALGHRPEIGVLCGHAVDTRQIHGEHRIATFERALVELYEAAPAPVMGEYFRTLVLADSARRVARDYGRRLIQAAESSPFDVLSHVFDNRG